MSIETNYPIYLKKIYIDVNFILLHVHISLKGGQFRNNKLVLLQILYDNKTNFQICRTIFITFGNFTFKFVCFTLILTFLSNVNTFIACEKDVLEAIF